MTTPLPTYLNRVQSQVQYLHLTKGMTIPNAIKEIEGTLRGKLPATLVNQIYYESRFWG